MSLMYHCFRWQGPCGLLRDPITQSDPSAAVPPPHAYGWETKPISLFVDSHPTPEAALDWLWHQMRHITSSARQANPDWPGVDLEADFAELSAELHGREAACEWLYRLPRDSCFLAAIVALRRREPTG